ncbi:hypothetical protein HDV00_002680 [Rhizophlyctis rosea]|nr:hypothetical protein HDV00_002680 [Rhizophlyctis rosea]
MSTVIVDTTKVTIEQRAVFGYDACREGPTYVNRKYYQDYRCARNPYSDQREMCTRNATGQSSWGSWWNIGYKYCFSSDKSTTDTLYWATPNVLQFETYPSLKTESVRRPDAYVGIWYFPIVPVGFTGVLRPGGADNGGGSPNCQIALSPSGSATTSFEAFVVAGDGACYRAVDKPALGGPTGDDAIYTPRYVKAICNATMSTLNFYS